MLAFARCASTSEQLRRKLYKTFRAEEDGCLKMVMKPFGSRIAV
jgi:hypothetical protein